MEDKVIDIKRKLKVTSEDVDDIMAGALEGGITYWCDEAHVEGNYLGEYAHEQISRGGKLILHDMEEEKEYPLDLGSFLKGLSKWVGHPGNNLVWEDNWMRLDCCQIDGPACDAIIQYALFDDIIYG